MRLGTDAAASAAPTVAELGAPAPTGTGSFEGDGVGAGEGDGGKTDGDGVRASGGGATTALLPWKAAGRASTDLVPSDWSTLARSTGDTAGARPPAPG